MSISKIDMQSVFSFKELQFVREGSKTAPASSLQRLF
jgi:hypothetical protein